uniref:Uncharacterized protein n=1 Tax=Anguilla anguilla TaxID=7936 RepID=A0A0E9PIH2_ANGAN
MELFPLSFFVKHFEECQVQFSPHTQAGA